jgi:hypothetical protein
MAATEAIALAGPAGEHWIVVRVKSATGYDQSKKIIESFSVRGKNILHVYCDEGKHSLELAL